MVDAVIKIEGVGKQYRLGQVGTGSLVHDLNRWWQKMKGKEDPYLKLGEENERARKGTSDLVWALKDVSFEVPRGEVLGIIGKNGAGKSTLLKILSRVTKPTTGIVKVKGRIASLLEVGTGFHPELTGRENIFLNGSILGMTKKEIQSKLDEIIDFSGVERYVDTPVKRYSSGMYVRLAFAVAAHLEPEILIIDEVLAVGDAEFQKKCLGKMKDVSGQGRTVLFVSHNMTAVNSLCSSCVYLKNGQLISLGNTREIVDQYLSNENASQTSVEWDKASAPGDGVALLHSARLVGNRSEKIDFAMIGNQIGIEYVYEVLKEGYQPVPNIHVFTSKGEYAFVSSDKHYNGLSKPGKYKATMWIPGNLLNEGKYIIGLALSTMSPLKVHFYAQEALLFDVIENTNDRSNDYKNRMPGVVRPQLTWETKQIE